MAATPVSKWTVVNFLFDSGVPYDAIEAPDASYMLPSKDWIGGEFANALDAEQRRRAMKRYQLGKWDCTKFTRMAAEFANECHADTAAAPENTSLAFGEFWYQRDGGEGHAINFAVCRTADLQLELVFFEPQLCRLIVLSKNEINRCDSARF